MATSFGPSVLCIAVYVETSASTLSSQRYSRRCTRVWSSLERKSNVPGFLSSGFSLEVCSSSSAGQFSASIVIIYKIITATKITLMKNSNSCKIYDGYISEEYKENFKCFKRRPSYQLKTKGFRFIASKFSLYFSSSCISTNESLLIVLAPPTLAQTVKDSNI